MMFKKAEETRSNIHIKISGGAVLLATLREVDRLGNRQNCSFTVKRIERL